MIIDDRLHTIIIIALHGVMSFCCAQAQLLVGPRPSAAVTSPSTIWMDCLELWRRSNTVAGAGYALFQGRRGNWRMPPFCKLRVRLQAWICKAEGAPRVLRAPSAVASQQCICSSSNSWPSWQEGALSSLELSFPRSWKAHKIQRGT